MNQTSTSHNQRCLHLAGATSITVLLVTVTACATTHTLHMFPDKSLDRLQTATIIADANFEYRAALRVYHAGVMNDDLWELHVLPRMHHLAVECSGRGHVRSVQQISAALKAGRLLGIDFHTMASRPIEIFV